MADETPYVPPTAGEVFSDLGEDGKCKNESHIPVFIDGKKAGCGSSSFFSDYYVAGTDVDSVSFIQGTVDQIYSMLYGQLPDGEYYEIGDLNEDGVNEVYSYTFNETGVKVTQSVYGYDDDGNATTTSYADWSAPDLSELIEKYGEDAVNTAKGVYDDLGNFIEGAQDDPLGAIVSILDVVTEVGIPEKCQDLQDCKTADPDSGTYCWKDCVNFNVLIGIPGLPSLPGIGDIGTYRDFEDALKEIGTTIGDVFEGNNKCGADTDGDEIPDEECTVGQVVKDLGTWVMKKLEEVLKGIEDATLDDAYDWIKGILGAAVGGYVFTQIEKEIKDVFFPIAPIDDECPEDVSEINADNFEKCGYQDCGDGTYVKVGESCDEQDPFDGTKCVEENYFNENKEACEDDGYVNCTGGENSSGQETTGGIIKGSVDDCDVIQDPQCSDVGTYNPDSGECDCPEGYEFDVETGGTCGEKDGDGTYDPVCTEPRPSGALTFALEDQQLAWDNKCRETHCESGVPIEDDPDCYGTDGGNDKCPNLDQVRRGGIAGAECVTPGVACFAEPSKYPGDSTDTTQGQFNSEGFCVEVPGPDNGNDESCAEGDELETKKWDYYDDDKDGVVTDSLGQSYSYDPCNPSLGFTLIDDNTGGNQGDECDLENGSGKGVKNANGDCVPVGSNCNRQQLGYGPEDNCDTGQGSYTPIGVIDSSGDCVCAAITEPPDPTDPCTQADPNSQSDGQGGCECKEDFRPDPETGKCVPSKQPPQELCSDKNATNNGELGPCVCPNGFTVSKDGKECIPVTTVCDNGATDYPDCVTCPSGQRINPETDQCEEIDCTDPANALVCGWVECDDGTMAPTLGDCDQPTPCSDPEYAAANPLQCGWVECPNGTFAPTRDECEETTCENGATDYPDCTVCPEGQSLNDEGLCVTIGEPPVTPPPTGGGGGGGGGGGMFNPFLAGISYTPQTVPAPPAPPQKDYMAELDNIIKRSLFEGMA